ncbi:hypothetical protein HGM15179_019550, partial [Zosterops borbonicus]
PSPPGLDWAGDRLKKAKGKPTVSAVEQKEHQKKADMEIIALLQDLVKALQFQLEEQKANTHFLQEGIRTGRATAHVLHEDLYHSVLLHPLIKAEYIYDGSTPYITTIEIPYTATELAKLKEEY